MAVSTEQVMKRFKSAKQRKMQSWDQTYEDVLEYFSPQFNTFDRQTPGQDERGQNRIYDSTPEVAMQKFASNMQSSLVPPMKKWTMLKPGNSVPEDQRKEAAEALEQVTNDMFAALKLSNFDVQVSEAFQDLAVGTGALMVLKGDVSEPFKFAAIPLSEVYFEEGDNSNVNAAFREFEIPFRSIELTWPNARVPDDVKRQYENNPDKKLKVVEATIPDKVQTFDVQLERNVTVDGFRHMVIITAGKHVIVNEEQTSNPWVIFRWAVRPGEIYGRGPALSALADAKSLNKVKEIILKAGSLASVGAYTFADDGVLNIENIRIEPGAIIPVSSNPGGVQGPSLAPLPISGRPDVSQFIFRDLQKSINEAMFADPIGPIDAPVKTATEVAIRQQELAKRIGASFGRLQYELIKPLINRMLAIMEDLGLADLSNFRVDGRFIDIEHSSPLSQAQDSEELISMERLVGLVAQSAGPQAATLLLMQPGYIQTMARLMGVSEKHIPSKDELQALVGGLAQAQAGAAPVQQGV